MAEEDEKPIRFQFVDPPLMIRTTSYKGCLIGKKGKYGRHTGEVIWTRYLSPRNKDKVLVNVYTYTTLPPADGTYVVLEFLMSKKFVYACEKDPRKIRLGDGDCEPYPENPEHITTTGDPRVFLMKSSGPDSRDVMFLWHGNPQYVITVFPNPEKPAENLPEGENGQKFQLVPPKLRCSEDGDCLEVVE